MDDFLDGFPLTPGFLERYRLAARQRAPAGQVGAHLLRRKGQSLELQDLVPFVPGDDFRHVDWRASARLPRPHDLLVRRFEAEERLTLAISIDNRPSMGALAPASKLRLAAWLAYAVTVMAAAGGDRVFLHSLFGPDATVERVRRTRASETARSWLAGLPQVSSSQAWPAHVQLPPAAVWMILTDLYFEDPGDVLARALVKAQRGWRWIILLDLDNWPHERAALGHGSRRILGPGVDGGEKLEVAFGTRQAVRVERTIREHKERFLRKISHGGLSVARWSWPARSAVDPGGFFQERFQREPVLQRLFRRRG